MCEYDEGRKRILREYKWNEKSPFLPLYFSPISILTGKKRKSEAVVHEIFPQQQEHTPTRKIAS